LKKGKESGVDLPTSPKETTKKKFRQRGVEVPSAKTVVVKGASFPFRLKGDSRIIGVEADNTDLFDDYAREQWMGTVVKKGMYLFDKYVVPDYAFQVQEVIPEESMITFDTRIVLETDVSTSKVERKAVSFDEIIGHDAVKRKCRIILRYLRKPSVFGEWAPRAVLFHGPPGTGKTLTARALASEAEANIFLAKASDLIGVHVGDGGRRISALFEDARKEAPSIIFIDELDAIGLTREFQSIRGDVSEVVTALLGELDRIDEDSGVVIIGATNAEHMIDSALRSRFDTLFEFALPNYDERVRILRLYANRLPITLNADIGMIASLTEGYSGRDLRDGVLKEALHVAIEEESTEIDNEGIMKVIDTYRKKKSLDYMI
jgi:AAA family ATPase